MNGSDVLRQRLANQQLVCPRRAEPGEVVAWLGAVQAQDYPGAKWGLGQRLPGATDGVLDRAFDEGAILRTHLLRPTWHFVAPADVRWLLQLTGPRVKAVIRYHDRTLGLDDGLFRRSNAAIAKALEGGKHLTRTELETPLRAAGIGAKGQTLGHLVMHAELDGVICSGPRRGKQFTYALLEERVPPARAHGRDEALAELVKRYFVSHGPATLHDFAWWSGLTIGDARRGIAMLGSQLVGERVDGLEYWLAPTTAPPMPETAYLLPNYDEYTIAYRDREVFYDAAQAVAVPRRHNVPFDHAVVVGGRVIGLWRRTFGKGKLAVETQLFVELDEAGRSELRGATERYGRFLGVPVVLDGRPG
ncbi:MAG TPA: winged helix DNA-binding domain-containing protein [Chloroflexota bacterium]|nr:winged helix DNA-binding domain-containing protein [Chloroflexota bacterium]